MFDLSICYCSCCYDTETGWYYLQSRYYDPVIHRFINADAFASTGQGFLGYNMFAYCANNPVVFLDEQGDRFVGFGGQFEVDVGGYTIGVEVIIYLDAEVCGDEDYRIVVYTYEGASVSLADLCKTQKYKEIAEKLIAAISTITVDENITKSAMIALQQMIFGDMAGSASFVVVLGNDQFRSENDYEGGFSSVTVALAHVRTCVAYSDKCTSISIGGSTSILFSMSFGQTSYSLLK